MECSFMGLGRSCGVPLGRVDHGSIGAGSATTAPWAVSIGKWHKNNIELNMIWRLVSSASPLPSQCSSTVCTGLPANNLTGLMQLVTGTLHTHCNLCTHILSKLLPGSGYNCSLLTYNDYYRIWGCSQMTSAFLGVSDTPWCLCQPIISFWPTPWCFCTQMTIMENAQSTIHLLQKGSSWA